MRAEGSTFTLLTVYKQSGRLPTPTLNVESLIRSSCQTGPSFLRDPNGIAEDEEEEIPPNEDDLEICKDAVSLKAQTSKCHSLGADRFSGLHSLKRAIANLIIVVKEFKRRRKGDQRRNVSVLSCVKNTLDMTASGEGTSGGNDSDSSSRARRKFFRRIESGAEGPRQQQTANCPEEFKAVLLRPLCG